MHVENYSKRDRFWYHPCLKLRYETTPEQIRYVLVEVRKMLYAHPKVLSEPLSVRFRGFNDYSLDLVVFAYIGVKEYSESLGVAEDLNLRIMDIVTGAGTAFALPTQLQFEAPAKMLDDEKLKTVERQVEEWRMQQALYLPNFPRRRSQSCRAPWTIRLPAHQALLTDGESGGRRLGAACAERKIMIAANYAINRPTEPA